MIIQHLAPFYYEGIKIKIDSDLVNFNSHLDRIRKMIKENKIPEKKSLF